MPALMMMYWSFCRGVLVPGAAAVVQLPLGARRVGLLDHRQDRRDADAPGDEEVARARHQREVVARAADAQLVAFAKAVDGRRAAAAVGALEHRDLVVTAVGRAAAQRILADEVVAEHQVDVRAGPPRGQNAAAGPTTIARIVKYSRDGKYITSWGKWGKGPGEFRTPHSLAMDSQGRLFVADRGNSRIQIFDQDGHFLMEWKQFGRPSGLYIDKNDTLYAIDADSTPATHPGGWKKGIWIGSISKAMPDAFVPDDAAGEGVVVAPDGNMYGAVNVAPHGITRYPRH